MKFGFVPVRQAEGDILAHGLQAAERPYENQLSYRISKGTCLTATHIADLEAEGHSDILVASLEEGDVGENDAAERVAAALLAKNSNLRVTQAKTGRVNLIAERMGVLDIETAAIHAANAVDPMITVATAMPFARTRDGFMVATVKIISYGVSQTSVDQVVDRLQGAMRVRQPIYTSSLMIETSFHLRELEKPSAKGINALNGRLAALGLWAAEHDIVRHTPEALTAALMRADTDVIFILTASATSDRRDIGPAALLAAGGTVTHFGMPVDPGNLLFFGELRGRPVIGLPGCARSPALNGADWVMQRLLCGIPVTPADIAAMGVGGLLKEMPDRPQTREISGKS
jgi:molybdenum cofactor cytidylyltransferase